jgi:glycosyltransferase involved in cell wall biosynthesis
MAARWKTEVDVTVLAPPEAHALVRSFLGDVELHALGSAGPRQAALGPMLALEYVRRCVAATLKGLPAADVVVAASHFTPDVAALSALARRGALGVGYVYHLVAGRSERDPRTLWSKADERLGLALLRRFAGLVFTSNDETAAALRSRGFVTVHTAVGVDLSSFSQTSLDAQRGVFLGRMVRTKGVQDAVRAWALVRRSLPDARLVMIGEGPEQDEARALAATLGVSGGIEWPGFVSEEEKRRILGSSRVLLAPSYEEGWGIAVCEAMASGVPVAAYRLPVLDSLFDSAYLGAPAGDVVTLAELVVRVLGDDSLAEDLARRGRETAARYDLSRVAQDELAVILSHLRG